MKRSTTPICEMQTRYPNLTRACQWIGHLNSEEACWVIWVAKYHISSPPVGKRVTLFGNPGHLISQAVRVRNM